MDNTDTWEVSDGLTSFRTVRHRFAMETTTDGACPPISRAGEGAGAVRLDGPTGRADRLGEPAWQRVHPLPVLGMTSVRPLQGAATQRGIALEKQVRRPTSRGSMRRGRSWRARGPRWSAGHASALKRPMRRVEPECPRSLRTGLSDTAKVGEPAYPLGPRFAGPRQGLARGGSAPLRSPCRAAMVHMVLAGAPSPPS